MRRLAILAILTIVALAGAGLALWLDRDIYAAQQGPGGPFLPQLGQQPADVSGLTIAAPDYTVRLSKAASGWVAASDAGYPVRTAPVTALINDLAAARRLEPKTRTPEWYHWIGVEDRTTAEAKSTLVTLEAAGQPLASVLIGKVADSLASDPVGGTFVRPAGDPQAWLVSGTIQVPASKAAWFEPLVDIPGSDLRRITIIEDGQVALDASRQAGDQPFSLTAPAGGGLNQSLMRRLASTLVALGFESVRKGDPGEFDAPGRTVRFTTADGLVLDAHMVTREDVPWVLFRASGTGAARPQIAARVDGWAFQLSDSAMLALLAKTSDLLTPEQAPTGPNAPGAIITDPAQLGLTQPQR